MRGMNREQCLAIMYIRRDHAQKYELGVDIIFDSLTLFTMWQLQEVVIYGRNCMKILKRQIQMIMNKSIPNIYDFLYITNFVSK